MQEIKGDPEDLLAQRAPLGWKSIGSIKTKESRVYQSKFVSSHNASVVNLHEMNTKLNTILWSDHVSCKNKGVFTEEEMVASKAVSKSLKFKDGKCELAIP